jgi:hypothetical protein
MMIITTDGLQDSLFQSNPDEYRRAIKLVRFLEVRDSTGTPISRIQRIDTETMEIDVVLTNPVRAGHTVYLDGDKVVVARAKVPHATLWIHQSTNQNEDYQVDKDLKQISKETE